MPGAAAAPTFQDIVEASNPYTPGYPGKKMKFDNLIVEQQVEVGTWEFKGVEYYIEKAIKFEYTYEDEHGVQIRDYLIVAYPGGGAY